MDHLKAIKEMSEDLTKSSLDALTPTDLKTMSSWGIKPIELHKEIHSGFYTGLFTAFQQVSNTLYLKKMESVEVDPQTGSISHEDCVDILTDAETASIYLVEETYNKTIWAIKEGLTDGAESARKVLVQLVQKAKQIKTAKQIAKNNVTKIK